MKKVFTFLFMAFIGGILGFSGQLSAQAPVNDSVCNAIPLVNFDTLLVFNNFGATADTNESTIAPSTVGPSGLTWNESGVTHSVWFTFIAPPSGAIKFDMCNDSTDFDTQLAVYGVMDCNDYATFDLRGANDDIDGRCPVGDEWASIIEVNCLVPGAEYYLLVDGWVAGTTADSTGKFGVVMSEIPGAPLSIGTLGLDPTCNNTGDGIAAVLAVGGDQNYTYLWNTGSTQSFLPNVGPGTYSVTVRDGCDSVMMATVVLDDPSNTAPLVATSADTVLRCADDSVGLGSLLQVKGGVPLLKENAVGVALSQNGYDPFTNRLRDPSGISNINSFSNANLIRCGDIAFGVLFVLDAELDQLYAINLSTGTAQAVGSGTGVLPTGQTWFGMAYDATTGTMYAVSGTTPGSGGQIDAALFTINLSTGVGTLVGPLSGTDAWLGFLACDNNGQLYGGDLLNDNLVMVDKVTANVTTIGFLGINMALYLDLDVDADFDPVTNQLYMINTPSGTFNTNLRVVDLTTGRSVPVASYPGGTFSAVLAIQDLPGNDYSYTWFPTNFMNNPTGANPNVKPPNGFPPYIVTVRDQCGNIAQDTIKVLAPAAMTVNASSTEDDGTGNGTATATPMDGIPPFTYSWNTGSDSSSITDLVGDSTYSYTVTDGCGTVVEGSVFVLGNTANEELVELGLSQLEVYPNPAQSSIFVKVETIKIGDVQIELLDARGSVVNNRVLRNTLGEEFRMEVSNLPAGMYILKVSTAEGTAHKKVVKQ